LIVETIEAVDLPYALSLGPYALRKHVIMKTNTDQSLVWELKGDKLLSSQKNKKAFEAYQKALELNPARLSLYDKLLALHDQFADNWDDSDFAYNMSLTMKKQELINPVYKRIHARLDVHFKTVAELIKKMLSAPTPEAETDCVERIVSCGSLALTFKEVLRHQKNKPQTKTDK